MATCRAHLHRYPRYFTAFPFRLDEKPLPRSHFRCQRIHLGAHEAAFLPLLLFRTHSKPFFPPRISQLLVGEARRNFFWLAFNSRAILHSKRCVWKIPRLAEYPFFLHLHHRRLFFGILSFCDVGNYFFIKKAPSSYKVVQTQCLVVISKEVFHFERKVLNLSEGWPVVDKDVANNRCQNNV